MTNFLIEWWTAQPRQVAGVAACVAVLACAFYLFWRDRSLRKRLADIQPDRRVPYLLHHSQLRDYSIIFSLVLLASLFILLFPEASHKDKETAPPAECTPPVIDADAAAQLPPSDPQAMIDLFTGDNAWYPNESTLDALKSRYENALIGSYILHHCKRTAQGEMEVILRALREDIIQFQSNPENPPVDAQELYASIVTAAEGSYEMIYRKTDCDGPETAMLEQQFANFVMHYKAMDNRKSGEAGAPEDNKNSP